MQTYFTSYFNTSLQLIAAYDGSQPLAIYLKNYFSANKKHGSKDRRWIAHFCYCYYRLGFALKNMSNDERLRIAIFLCTDKKDNWLSLYDEEWQRAYDENITVRIALIQSKFSFQVADIFFNNNYLSNSIDVAAFNGSHLVQPLVFLRLRPGETDAVFYKLKTHNTRFEKINDTCLAFDNATHLDRIIYLNKEAVIQDYSSQQIASFFSLINLEKPIAVWDCCAASGGKSILAYDFFGSVKLSVSDIRSSIIHNLTQRFRQAGIHQYQFFVADVSSPQFSSKHQYDLVICDAPCSGSGTWSRTPEQLAFFKEEKLLYYSGLQKKISVNAAKAVKKGGYFLYITCSVLRQENEEVASHICQQENLTLLQQEVIRGYDKKADTMFAAMFIRE